MAVEEGKTKAKRLSKSERVHRRRLKQAARKPGGDSLPSGIAPAPKLPRKKEKPAAQDET